MRFTNNTRFSSHWAKWSYTLSLTLFFHKAFEASLAWNRSGEGLEVRTSITSRGDHAGLKVHLVLWKLDVDVSLYDSRHWCYAEKRWYRSNEERPFEGYPHE